MREFRKKQKRLYNAMKAMVIIAAVLLFSYIGAEPYIRAASSIAATVCSYVCDFSVIAVLVLLFTYYSKYSKTDAFLTSIENEIEDTGYYFTSRTETEIKEYSNAVRDDLKKCGYSVNENFEVNELDFDFCAYKSREFFYGVCVNNIDRNDVLAYLDSAIYDITVQNLKRKGSGVICFFTDNAEDSAVAMSKMMTYLGKKNQIKIALAICETDSKRVYFLGNVKTKCQQMIANFAMNCDVPLKEQFVGKEKLPFQQELEEKMKSFNLKDFKNGNFTVH